MRDQILKSALAVFGLLATTVAQTAAPGQPTVIPVGTKIVLSLQQAVSTRNARDGDPIYAETVFPVIAGNRVAMAAGTPVEGVVFKVKHAGKLRGHAQIGIRFTSMIRNDGTVVSLSGQISNTPGGERLSVDQAQSSIVGDLQTRAHVDEDLHQVSRGAFHGMFLGLLFGGTVTAMRVGVGLGMAGGLAFAILGCPTDMRLRPGTQIQITLQSPVQLAPSPTSNRQAPAAPAATPSERAATLILTEDEHGRQP